MLILALMMAAQSGEVAITAEGWARKAKPVASCSSKLECDEKWEKAKAWVRSNSRFQIAVDQPDLFATYGAVYANTDLSFVLARRPGEGGAEEIVARAWCGNIITCKPKPKNAVASITRELN